MAVNGIEIIVGQRWKTIAGHEVTVTAYVPGADLPWQLQRKCAGSTTYSFVSSSGKRYGGMTAPVHPDDLAELLAPEAIDPRFAAAHFGNDLHVGDSHQVLTFHELPVVEMPGCAPPVGIGLNTPADTGRTNPKDAIGDKKLALHLLSPIAEAHWVVGQYAGMLKYGAWNWRAAGVRASIYISALRRHLAAYISGEEYDPVDGSHHLGNIMACAAILLEARAIGKLTDDRPPSFSHRETYAWAEAKMAELKVQYKDMAPRHYRKADTAECFAADVERVAPDDSEGGLP
jgi:hypothetical protein